MKSSVLKNKRKYFYVIFFAIFCIFIFMLGDLAKVYATDEAFESQLNIQGFPESYKAQLRIIHEKYPNWNFKAVKTQVNWDYALQQEMVQGRSLVHVNQPDSYKSVGRGDYDFNSKYYIGKDSSQWVTASKEAIAYYLDPRNFLNERSIFMFEDLRFNPSYQSEEVVKKILLGTAMPDIASSYFMKSAYQVYNGKEYSISPTHLAARVRQELGNTTFMISGEPFTYLGLTYRNLYNPYNIGATSGNDAAKRGLIYANGGYGNQILNTSYNRPWDTLEKGILGGALVIADGYINDGQNTLYLQKFNVNNGLSNVGTHQYMTNIMAPYGESSTVYDNYLSYGVLNQGLTFTIPVYENMPTMPAAIPSSTGNNNCYLDSLSIDGYKMNTSFDRFTNTYVLENNIDKSVLSVNVKAVANAADARVEGIGKFTLKDGSNFIKVKVISSTGKVNEYIINGTRSSNGVLPKPDGDSNNNNNNNNNLEIPANFICEMKDGKTVKLSWDKVKDATGYRVRYKQSKYSKWYYTEVSTNNLEKIMSTIGTEYDFKVRSFTIKNGKKVYGKDYTGVIKTATFGTVNNLKYNLLDKERNVNLTWDDVVGADSYEVWYKRSQFTKWYKKTVTDNSFTKLMEAYNTKYDFKIVPVKNYNNIRYVSKGESDVLVVETVLEKVNNPTNFKVTLITNNKANLTWDEVNGATGYRIRYKQAKYSKWYYVEVENNHYEKTMATLGTVYDFKVRAFNSKDGKKIYSESYTDVLKVATFGDKGKIRANLSSTGKSLKLTWTEVKGATGYRVYFKENSSKNWLRKDTIKKDFTKLVKSSVGKYDFKIIPYRVYDGMKYFSNDVHGPLTYDISKRVD